MSAMALDYTPGILDKSAPARIWLQIDTAGDNGSREDTWCGPDGVTWQDEPIGGLEIQYVRADIHAQMVEKVREVAEWMAQHACAEVPGMAEQADKLRAIGDTRG